MASNTFIEYKSKTVIPTQELKNLLCYPKMNTQEQNSLGRDFINGLDKAFQALHRPFEFMDQFPDEKVYSDFQKLRIVLQSTTARSYELKTTIETFVSSYDEAVKTLNISYHDDSRSWVSKLAAKEASYESLLVIRSLSLNGFYEANPTYYSYLMDPNLEGPYYKEMGSGPEITSSKYDVEVLLEKVNSALDGSITTTDIESAILSVYQINNQIRAMMLAYPDYHGNRDTSDLSETENVANQLLGWSKNPKEAICGGSRTQLDAFFDWCIGNDDRFVEAIERVAEQANSTAAGMLKSKKMHPIRGYVGVRGDHCYIRGYYHLIKSEANDVSLYTSGNIYVTKSSGTEKGFFTEENLLEALSSKQNFNLY